MEKSNDLQNKDKHEIEIRHVLDKLDIRKVTKASWMNIGVDLSLILPYSPIFSSQIS